MIAQAKGRITEIDLQVAQIDQDMRSEVGKELSELRAKLAEMRERRIAAADQLSRSTIRAPLDGVVHQMSVHTVGGVISPGETLMYIAPRGSLPSVESKLAPRDIDHVHIGQTANLRFSAFDQRTTPEVAGIVTYVSADTLQDSKNGSSHYTVRIAPEDGFQVKGVSMVPGMPVETFISTGERTVLSFLAKPLADQIARTWREK
jgi:HlyD family secretion protein